MKIAFYTLGCKVNQYETQALAVFTYVETIQYTNELLYSVLSEALNIQE